MPVCVDDLVLVESLVADRLEFKFAGVAYCDRLCSVFGFPLLDPVRGRYKELL